MRLADADLLPYQFKNTADAIRQYVNDLQKSLKDSQEQMRERNRQIEEGVFSATSDPKKTFVPPPVERVPIFMNFAPLQNGLETFEKSVNRYQRAIEQAQAKASDVLTRASIKNVNQSLLRIEQSFTSPDGLPDRPWFRHQIYAPGAYTGYDAKPIAAVREAMDKKDWEQADKQIPRIGQILETAAAAIDAASAQLENSMASVSK
jgi:N-acetylated-alpha-linked acidic dipeptidase